MPSNDSLRDLTRKLREFAAERDWDQFHTPVNLAAALSVEAAELQEQFLWNTPLESIQVGAEKRARIAEEIADVLLYLVRLADKLGIDAVEAANDKLLVNASKYPADKARGNHKKYTDL